MNRTRLYLSAALLSLSVLGCAGAVEEKKMPTQTPEQKAASDKAHEEMKAKMAPQGGAAPAETPK
jgi:hypothetical protein